MIDALTLTSSIMIIVGAIAVAIRQVAPAVARWIARSGDARKLEASAKHIEAEAKKISAETTGRFAIEEKKSLEERLRDALEKIEAQALEIERLRAERDRDREQIEALLERSEDRESRIDRLHETQAAQAQALLAMRRDYALVAERTERYRIDAETAQAALVAERERNQKLRAALNGAAPPPTDDPQGAH